MRQDHDRRGHLLRPGALALAVAAAGLVLAACGGGGKGAVANSTTTSNAASGSTTTAPGATSTTAAPTTTIPFTISQVHSGTGPATLAQFSVPAKAKEWDLDWVYDCAKTGGTGSFKVAIVGHGAAANTTDAGVSQSGHGTAGIAKNFDTGTFNLNIATTCAWTVRVEVT